MVSLGSREACFPSPVAEGQILSGLRLSALSSFQVVTSQQLGVTDTDSFMLAWSFPLTCASPLPKHFTHNRYSGEMSH